MTIQVENKMGYIDQSQSLLAECRMPQWTSHQDWNGLQKQSSAGRLRASQSRVAGIDARIHWQHNP